MNGSTIFEPIFRTIDKVIFGFEDVEDTDELDENPQTEEEKADAEEEKVVFRSIN